MFFKNRAIGYPSTVGYGSTISNVGYSGISTGYGVGSGLGYSNTLPVGTVVTPSRYAPKRFGLRRDTLGFGGRHHFIRRWRNASPIVGGRVKHSPMFYGNGFGSHLSLWQKLKLRLGFGKIHYGVGTTVTANSGWGAPTYL